jgi:hypothetical protein
MTGCALEPWDPLDSPCSGSRSAVTGPQIQVRQHRGRDIPDPPGDRQIALHPRHDRCRGQRQHRRDRMSAALTGPAMLSYTLQLIRQSR